jgi:hypothetical protein
MELNPTEDNSIPTFEKFSEIKPPRSLSDSEDDSEVGLPETQAGSLRRRTEIAPKMSDFQVVDKRLFPVLKEGLEWLNNLMVARVFPETIIPLKNIIIKHLLQEFNDISFAEAVCIAEVAVTVALDSEGRIDIARVFAKSGEIEDDKDKNKGI